MFIVFAAMAKISTQKKARVIILYVSYTQSENMQNMMTRLNFVFFFCRLIFTNAARTINSLKSLLIQNSYSVWTE